MFVFLLLSLINLCVSEYCPRTPCSIKDQKCLQVLFNGVSYDVIEGIPKLNIVTSDPLRLDSVQDRFATVEFQLNNITVTGLRNISYYNILFSDDLKAICFTINSPSLSVNSILNGDGYLITLPVDGPQNTTFIFGRQTVIVYATLEIINATDGSQFIQFGNYSLDARLRGNFTTNSTLDNVVGENEPLKSYKSVDQVVAENGVQLYYLIKNALWYPIVEKLLQNINIYFASVPKSKLFKCAI